MPLNFLESLNIKPLRNLYQKNEKILLLLFFSCFIAIGIKTTGDYGISWDEVSQRNLGQLNYEYIIGKNEDLLGYVDRDYGAVYEIFLYATEIALVKNGSAYQVFILRHFINHMFFLSGALILFLLIRTQFRSAPLAWAGMLAYLLMPRLYAHSYFNTKDIPFLVASIYCLYLMTIAFKKYGGLHFFIYGAACGGLTNIRIMGIQLVVFTLVALVLDLATNKKDRSRIASALIIFTLTFIFTLIAIWPHLWGSPVESFLSAFNTMASFTRWDGEVLFNGDRIKASNVPWHYTLTWILITTPVTYLVFIVIGILMLFSDFFKNTRRYLINGSERTTMIYFLFFLSPIVAVIYFDSTLYDGWRQMYFIYSGMLLLLVYSLHKISRIDNPVGRTISNICILLMVFQWVMIAFTMHQIHPWHNLYFNSLVTKSQKDIIQSNWEYDYSGTSYKAAVDFLAQAYPNETYSILFNHRRPGQYNLEVFGGDATDKYRILDRSDEKVDFYVTDYRGNSPNKMDAFGNHATKIYSLIVQNTQVVAVYKMNNF